MKRQAINQEKIQQKKATTGWNPEFTKNSEK